MTKESLARKFKPAGFDQPEGSRMKYIKPRKELQEMFYHWVRELPDDVSMSIWSVADKQYQKARDLVKSVGEIPYMEANSLLVALTRKEMARKRLVYSSPHVTPSRMKR